MYEELATEMYLSNKFKQTAEPAFKKRIERQEKETLYKIKSQFQKSLSKLNDECTKTIGFRELQNIVLEHQSNKCLRLYLSLLCDKIMQTDRTEVILMFGFLAQVYKTNLVDPLDKPPNLIKTIVRI